MRLVLEPHRRLRQARPSYILICTGFEPVHVLVSELVREPVHVLVNEPVREPVHPTVQLNEDLPSVLVLSRH